MQRPDSWNHDGSSARVSDPAEKCPRIEVESVDRSIAKIADEQSIVEIAEAFEGRPGHPPRRIEDTFAGESLEQISLSIEDVDETIARPGDIICFGAVPLGVSHINVTVNCRDPEWTKTRRNFGVDETAGRFATFLRTRTPTVRKSNNGVTVPMRHKPIPWNLGPV